jgi:hypothetical protein
LNTQDYDGHFSLNKVNEIATLDYGYEVGGYQHFEVASFTGLVQLEVRYSEGFWALGFNYSDGPFTFANGLTNNFRVETFEISQTGATEAFLIQGGLRWTTVRLLTPGTVTFSKIGFRSSISTINVDSTPGSFQCSNNLYNQIWNLGARASTAACVDSGTQTSTWEVSESGTMMQGQLFAYSSLSDDFENYTLTFDSKILRGGTGWSIAGSLNLVLTGDLPKSTTFVNTNTSLTPPNSIILAAGWSFVNQTTLPSYFLDTFYVPFDVQENKWYTIETTISGTLELSVSVDGTQVFNVSLNDYYKGSRSFFSPPSWSAGPFGFAPWQDQLALYKNVYVHADNGTQIYYNPMTAPNTAGEFGVATLDGTVCLDGAKRDREVWLGDFFHTSHIIPVSTSRSDHIIGTLNFVLDRQYAAGPLPINALMGLPIEYLDLSETAALPALADYQILGLLAFESYFTGSGDIEFASETWPKWKKQIAWLISNVDNSTHLVTFSGFLGEASGTAISAALVQALDGASAIASFLNDPIASYYSSISKEIADGVNKHLWNANLGVYSNGLADLGNFSVAGTAFAITSGLAPPDRIASSLAALDQLKLWPGYKDNSADSTTDPTVNLSPNTNGFLLSALFSAKTTAPAKYLLDNLWGAMVTNNSYNSGASWEYVGQAGEPGLSRYTSLSHPWGGAPTYILTHWIAGIRPVTPGYQTFIINPVIDGLGLRWAKGTIQTKYGALSSSWSISGDDITFTVASPSGTTGSVVFGCGKAVPLAGGRTQTAKISQEACAC